MAELKSLTIGGNTYDSFPDLEARAAIEAGAAGGSADVFYVTVDVGFDFSESEGSGGGVCDPEWPLVNAAYLANRPVKVKLRGQGFASIILDAASYNEDVMSFSAIEPESQKVFSAEITSSSDVTVRWKSVASVDDALEMKNTTQESSSGNIGGDGSSSFDVSEIRIYGESYQAGIPTIKNPSIVKSAMALDVNGNPLTDFPTLRSINLENGDVLRDEIVVSSGKAVLRQKIGSVLLKGGYAWGTSSAGNTSAIIALDTTKIPNYVTDIKKGAEMLCDAFLVFPNAGDSDITYSQASNTTKASNLRIKVLAADLGLTTEVLSSMSADDKKAAYRNAWDAWLDKNRTYLVYIKNEEETVDISSEAVGQQLISVLGDQNHLSWQFKDENGQPSEIGNISITYSTSILKSIDAAKEEAKAYADEKAFDLGQDIERLSVSQATTNIDVEYLEGKNFIPTVSAKESGGIRIENIGGGNYKVTKSEATANVSIAIYNNKQKLPENVFAGHTYCFGKNFPFGINMIVKAYDASGTVVKEISVSKQSLKAVQIPQNSVGMSIALFFDKTYKYANTVIETEMYSANSAKYLAEKYHGAEQVPPMITIIDDDGNSDFRKYLMPIVEGHWTGIGQLEDGIKPQPVPIASAVPVASVGNTGTMTWEQIEDCAKKGAEILSHTYNNIGRVEVESNNMTVAEIVYDYRRAQAHLRQHGIVSDGLVFVMDSSNNDDCVAACEQVYKYGFKASSQRINYKGEIDRYGIYRHGGTFYTFEALKHLIDKLVTDQTGWLVFMLHTSYKEHNVTDLVDGELKQLSTTSTWADWTPTLAKAIDYAVNKSGIPIVTTEYGVRMYCD